MKKLLIVTVCLALVLTLAFTLGALGKKPDKPEYVNYEVTFEEESDVTGTVHLGVQGRYICSSYEARPIELWLSDTFNTPSKVYEGTHKGLYLDLSEHKTEITMQYFFPDPDTGDKVQLNVYGGELVGEDEWLSSSFTIEFVSALAEILPTKGKRIPHWSGNVNLTIECLGVKE